MAEIKFEIVDTIAVLSESSTGWKKELNLVSWNGRDPKYDLRDWSPNYEKMGKGLTLSNEEVIKLKEALNNIVK
ncbi:YdbC family protein [Bacillus sp. 522_BSPC]|uniref:YdbC family protein n=1 Tax=Bacillus sp. 522_BSPC TaxID=1579338 RepID=UPI00065F9F40|nr:PC4/YdbC family ssDNA-binding protein [Bacillus sp. 522_BSPC]